MFCYTFYEKYRRSIHPRGGEKKQFRIKHCLARNQVVARKHRRRIYRERKREREREREKKQKETRRLETGKATSRAIRYHFPFTPIHHYRYCHTTQCFKRPFTVTKKRRNGTPFAPKLARYFLRNVSLTLSLSLSLTLPPPVMKM